MSVCVRGDAHLFCRLFPSLLLLLLLLLSQELQMQLLLLLFVVFLQLDTDTGKAIRLSGVTGLDGRPPGPPDHPYGGLMDAP